MQKVKIKMCKHMTKTVIEIQAGLSWSFGFNEFSFFLILLFIMLSFFYLALISHNLQQYVLFSGQIK